MLSTLGTAGATAVGGCLSRANETAALSKVALLNLRDREVEVAKDGEVRFDRTFALAADSGSEPNPAPVIREPWMETAGRFRVTVLLPESDERFSEPIPVRGKGIDCYYVAVRIRPEVVDFPIGGGEHC